MKLLHRLIAWLCEKEPINGSSAVDSDTEGSRVTLNQSLPLPPRLAECNSPPAAFLNLGGGFYVLGPTPELMAEAERWNEIVRGYPEARLTQVESARWH